MSLEHLRASLLGLPLQVSPNRRNHYKKPASFVRGECSDRSPNPKPSVFGQEHKHGELGPFYGGRKCIIFPVGNLSFRNSRMRMNCTNETFSRSRALVRSLSPLWKEGLLIVRCSIFCAVLSAAAMVVWYGQLRARSFIQSQFMPSICSMLSEYLQRELDFGRVRSISPLGITLQSCSIGPHREEFSCGELPTLKLRVRPLASLRRGKIVIDAVLSRPSILIAQKEDFSWLGIPSPSEDDMNRHSSCEEGIDYRTKARRLAREDAAAKWYRDRSAAAREAAVVGYNVPQECSDIPMVDDFKNGSSRAIESVNVASFFCMDDRLHRRDYHSVDLGMEYALKHSELEKSFGINIDRKGFKFWPSITSRPLKRKTKREGGRKLMPEADITYKQRNLERSAAAALAYFRDLDDGNSRKSSAHQGDSFPVLDSANEEVLAPIVDEMVRKTINDPLDIFEHQKSDELVKLVGNENEKDITGESPANGAAENDVIHRVLLEQSNTGTIEDGGSLECKHCMKYISAGQRSDGFSFVSYPFLTIKDQLIKLNMPIKSFRSINSIQKDKHAESGELSKTHETGDVNTVYIVNGCEAHDCAVTSSSGVEGPLLEALQDNSEGIRDKSQESTPKVLETHAKVNNSLFMWFPNLKLGSQLANHLKEILANCLANQIQSIKLYMSVKAGDLAYKFTEGVDLVRAKGLQKSLPVSLDSVYFTDGTLLLLGYGDQEPREMDNVDGHVKFQNHYTRVHVQLSGNCREWRSDDIYNDGGQLSTNVFVDIVDQKWHANLKIENLFAPLFERILELPVAWSKGRASGEVHICMSGGETFPNLHGQLDVHDLAFQILDAPSCFSETTANLCFRGQRVFLHNASGRFGDVPLEASGDFGINPDEGEFHLMCQVPCVEANSLMKSLKMKPLIFSLAGSVTAVFNCQGPLDAPVFVGSGIISRKTPHLVSTFPPSPASEAVNKNKEAGAVAAFDHIPFLHVSANFTFNTDNCVADLYGMRANLLDGGEIRGAGNAWICPEGEVDDSAMDVNLSGNLFFDKVIYRYIPTVQLLTLKIGELNGETKLSGSLLKPRFDIKWAAPKAEESFADARGDVIISHDYITINSSSVAFDLYTKIQTSYPDEHWQNSSYSSYRKSIPLTVEGVDLDLRMRGFEFSSLFFSNPFDSPRPVHLKATGKIKFLGKVVKPSGIRKKVSDKHVVENEKATSLVGEVSLTGIKLNQLMLAPQLGGSLAISHQEIKLDATGRPDESMSIEVAGPLWPSSEEVLQNKTLFSVLLQKGQLRAIIHYQPHHFANIEVRNLPLDELELASLRGTIQRAELQLNFQKRRGHGLLSVLHPKFSGVLGEALDVAARWSGDVITIEKTVLEQAFSHYEIQGEYVLPGTRDRYSSYKERDGLLKKALDGHLGSVISSMGRWRMRLEVPHAEVAEMLPLARLLSRSIDPAVHSRSKDFFMQGMQAMGFYAESLRGLLEAIQRNFTGSDDIVIEEIALPGLAELRGHWRGSLDASGGGDGDTTAEFDFRGEDWEWGSYKSQRVLVVGAYSNNNGLRLDNMFIQKDNATLHADGTVLGPITNLHFAVLNFPVGLVPAVAQVLESSTSDFMGSLWQLLAPMKGILHMEGDLRGNLSKPECDVQVRLLDGAVGGIDLGRAEVVASMTPNSRFLFNANFEPVTQSGHVHVQGSVPITYVQNDTLEEEGKEDLDRLQTPGWVKDNVRGSIDENEKWISRDRVEDGWDAQLAESLKGLNWNLLDDGEVRIDADIKDGGMTLLTALCHHASWIHGYADINLQVRGTVEQPVVDGSASFHRASVSSPVLRKPLTNLGGTIHVKSNRLCIISMESRVSRKGKLVVKGNLPLKTSESSIGDKIALKCEVFEVRAKNVFSGQVDSQMQITGSILQPNISGKIKLSHGEAYLPHDKGNGDAINRLASKKSSFPTGGFGKSMPSGHVSRFFGSESASSPNRLSRHSAKQDDVEKAMDQNNPGVDVRLSDLRVFLGPELRILYPLILNFAVSGELELNGMARPKLIRPKGVLTFENGDVNLVATQVRLKRDHLNVAKFEPDLGLDPTLDLALVGSEWQFRIQSPASKWQDSLVVTSTRSVDQDVLSPTEAAKVFENQLAESLLESDGQLAFKKLATATLETLMPKIEGKGEFGQARWRLVYAPQIPSLLSVDPTVDPLKSLANNISLGTEVEVQLGKRLQVSVVRQMKDSEMAMQWTLVYQLTSRLRVLFQSSPSTRLLFEYSATSQN